MRAMIALENRFLKTKNGNIYSSTNLDYSFWERYLKVFDEVIVFARVADIPENELSKPQANGPKVIFFELPYYIGVKQYITKHFKIKSLAKVAIKEADVFILRIPGRISTMLWYQLEKNKIPYGVEVVGSSLDISKTTGANLLIRVILNIREKQREQCQQAIAASYVTEHYLQKNFPTGGWATNYSTIDLIDEAFIEDEKHSEQIAYWKRLSINKKTIKVCHIGTMDALYKAQDILIEAVYICRKHGYDIQVTFLGDGKYSGRFKQKAKELGISEYLQFPGRVTPGKDVSEQLDKADLFVFPSVSGEGLPKAIIEAMARGLPCIGSNVCGIPELLDKDVLVAPGDAEALANKIIEVITNKTRMISMMDRNLEKAKEFHYGILNQRRIEFYKKIAEFSKEKIKISI